MVASRDTQGCWLLFDRGTFSVSFPLFIYLGRWPTSHNIKGPKPCFMTNSLNDYVYQNHLGSLLTCQFLAWERSCKGGDA